MSEITGDGQGGQLTNGEEQQQSRELVMTTPAEFLALMGLDPEMQKRYFEAMNALEDPSVDTMKAIFMAQKLLEDQVLADPVNRERFGATEDAQTKNIATAIIHEAVELQRLTDFKWWKKPKEFDRQAAKEELIDIWHFVVQGSIALGLTPEEIRQVYKEKNAINFRRMATGY